MTARATSPDRVLGYRCHQVLQFIRARTAIDGCAPSYGMIRDEFGIDKCKVADIVKRLEKRGLLSRVGTGRVRRIRLAVQGEASVAAAMRATL
jgi:predicted transcriptional regulator of viral defense system